MGSGPSQEFLEYGQNDWSQRYEKILKKFHAVTFVPSSVTKIFGRNCKVYEYTRDQVHFKIVETSQVSENEADMIDQMSIAEGIMNRQHVNILTNHMCRMAAEESMCSPQEFKIYKLHDYVEETLEDEMAQRAEKKAFFSELELWSILEQVASALNFIEGHDHLRADTIYIVHTIDSRKLYKLAFKATFNSSTNYDDYKNGIVRGRYLSEEGLKCLQKGQDKNYCHSIDKTSLGMVMLAAGNLEMMDLCYDHVNYTLKNKMLSDKLQTMMSRYSQDLCSIVHKLIIDDQQFDWNNFNQTLSILPQLRGGQRVQDSYQTINIDLLPAPIAEDSNGYKNSTVESSQLLAAIQQKQLLALQQQQQQQAATSSQQIEGGGTFNAYNNQQQQQNNNMASSYTGFLQSQQNQGNSQGADQLFSNSNNGMAASSQNPVTAMFFQGSSSAQPHSANGFQLSNNSSMFSANPISNNVGTGMFQQSLAPQQQAISQSPQQQNELSPQLLQQLLAAMMNQQQQNGETSQHNQQGFGGYENQHPNRNVNSPLKGANVFQIFNSPNKSFIDQNALAGSAHSMDIPVRHVGKLSYKDGSHYEGELTAHGQRDGFGKLVFANKGVYEGGWRNDKMHGKGVLLYPDGDEAYSGEWFEGQFNGLGNLTNKSAEFTKQPFDFKDFDGLRNHWLTYEGDFQLDRKHGFGTLTLTNGEKYSGNFYNDQVHGYGVFYQLNGQSFSGNWSNNRVQQRL